MNWIKRIWIWMRRCRYSRGFGVQSPWAYHFIRYVVNEHAPYYQYRELAARVPYINKVTRRLCRFYFRLANAYQPSLVVDVAPETDAYQAYFAAGCRKAAYTQVDDVSEGADFQTIFARQGTVIVRLSLISGLLERVLAAATPETVLVAQSIHRSAETRRCWEALQADQRVGVTFDLYDCGVVFFDKKMQKQAYIVNF